MRAQEIAYSRTPEFTDKLKHVTKVSFQKDWRKVKLEFEDGSSVTVTCKDLQQIMYLIEDLHRVKVLDLDAAANQALKILHKALEEAESELSASPSWDA